MAEQKLATLKVKGYHDEGLKNVVNVRNLKSFFVDEPKRLGGTNSGPNPLEYFLGAYSACTSIMAAYTAKDLNFSYSGLEFKTEGTLDPRGYQGVEGIRTYFQNVKIEVIVQTDQSEVSLQQFKKEVERRCPLHNLLVDAGVEVSSNWMIQNF